MAEFRILIIDDHHEVRHMLQAGVESLGPRFDVISVPSGEEALLEASRKPIHLMVSDVRLPGITGLELMAKIKQRHPGMKVILITGITDLRIRQQVAEAGANAFFLKPIVMADFLDAIERTLGIVKTLLPEAPIAPKIEKPTLQLSQQLTELRRETNALAVFLISEVGEILAQAGDFPQAGLDPSLIQMIMTVSHAGTKVSHLMGLMTPETLFYIKGAQYNLFLTQVGSSHDLLVVTEKFPKTDTPGQIANIILSGSKRILDRLSLLDASQPLPREETPPPTTETTGESQPVEPSIPEEILNLVEIPEEDLKSVENLFKQASVKQLDDKELDSFWDSALEENDTSGNRNASALSYDEAQRLGLAPKQDKSP